MLRIGLREDLCFRFYSKRVHKLTLTSSLESCPDMLPTLCFR